MIKTPRTVQQAIINLYKKKLLEKGVKVIKPSRAGPHLRIKYLGDIKKLLNTILKCSLEDTDNDLSGTYNTQILTVKQSRGKIKKGDQIYFVSATRDNGVVSTKMLSPDSFQMSGKTLKKKEFYDIVNENVMKMEIDPSLKSFMMDLLKASGSSGLLSSNTITTVSNSDLKAIAKDFGEITGAFWFMNNYDGAQSVSYPIVSNAALVDYHINFRNHKMAVSAKANNGSPPSINAIAEILEKIKYRKKAMELARQSIITIRDKSVVDGILDVSRCLNTEGYAYLKRKVFKKDFSATDCEDHLSSFRNYRDLVQELLPFYEIIGRSASDLIIKRIVKQKARRYGLVLSPLGYSLIDRLNSDDNYLKVLNDAANQIEVTQIYMKINKIEQKVTYEVKPFQFSQFKFRYNSNAGMPALKKISFTMK